MSLVALDGTPLLVVGFDSLPSGATALPGNLNTTVDAVNESCQFIGHIVTEDGASHTLDTSGSSSIGWRTGVVTFNNGGTTAKVGLATVDATTGPVARATNSSDVVTYSVSKSMTGGGGGITGNAWQEHVPDTGSLSVANGDLLAMAVQLTARGGADSLVVSGTVSNFAQRPVITQFVGGAYAAGGGVPNCIITFSDGALGWFLGGLVWTTTTTTQTWNSGSAQVEYGNYFSLPFPTKIYGFANIANFTANCDLVLYTDPLGTPAAAKTLSVDTNQTQVANVRYGVYLFPSPYEASANQPLAAIFKPGASNVSAPYKTFHAASHAKSETCGTNCYAVSRASGAFAAVNSNKDRFGMGLLLGAFDNGVGGASGYPASRILAGM